jgi:hypothetical protein
MKSIKDKIENARFVFVKSIPDWVPGEAEYDLYCNIPSELAIQIPLMERIENYETSKRTR